MESEDDICILGSEEDEVDWGNTIHSPPSPFHTKTPDTGSHHALQKAYFELKKRFNETSLRNQALQQRINQLEVYRGTAGVLTNMSEDNMSYSAQGGAAMPGSVDAQMAAEEGYVTMLKREIARQKAQLQRLSAVEKKYQDVLLQNETLKQQMASLSQAVIDKGGNAGASLQELSQQLQNTKERLFEAIREKEALEQKHSRAVEEKEQAVKSREELRAKCQSLGMETDRGSMEGSSLNNSLQKANQGQTAACCHPPELFAEVTHMRKVIDSLKKLVLQQRQYLIELESKSSFSSVRSSMGHSLKDISSVQLDMMPAGKNRSSGSQSSQSWELVNGTQHHSEDVKLPQRASRTFSELLGQREPGRATVQATSAGHVVTNGGPVVSSTTAIATHQPRRASSDVIRRKTDGENVKQKRVKTEYIRSPQDMSDPNFGIWIDSQAQQHPGAQQQPVAAEHGEVIAISDTNAVPVRGSATAPFQQQQSHHVQQPWANFAKKDTVDMPYANAVPSQPPLLQFVQSPPVFYPAEHQLSPMRDLPSSYDNIQSTSGFGRMPTMVPNNTISNMVQNPEGTSIHVLNQTVMAGARVLRSSADGFSGDRSSAGTSNMGPPMSPGTGVTHGSPQEHTDMSAGRTVTTSASLNATQQSADLVTQKNNGSGGGNSKVVDRKCPVCSQDFSHISMDEFQTHVFECFDDDDCAAPETLQPQKNTDSQHRLCPMCQKEFGANISQPAFEQHVDSHFDDAIIDHFEFLDVNRI